MAQCIESWHTQLESGEKAVLIVGNNRTTANGEQIMIPTPDLLGEVAEARGFVIDEVITLETWPRYGIHSKNSVRGEKAIVIRRT
jgi:hypothetical protein